MDGAMRAWQGKVDMLRPVGWSRHRRVIVLRRRVKSLVVQVSDESNQLDCGAEIEDDTQIYEYAVLVTSTQALLLST
jgi:hypothetical protein